MKTKTFEKKLNVSKSTIAHLDNAQMVRVLGGETLDTCKKPTSPCQTPPPDTTVVDC